MDRSVTGNWATSRASCARAGVSAKKRVRAITHAQNDIIVRMRQKRGTNARAEITRAKCESQG